MTTPRENLLRVFKHETPDRLPLSCHCDPYNQPSREGMPPELAAALGEVQWSDESSIILSRHLGLDIMDSYRMPMRISQEEMQFVVNCCREA